MGKQKRQLSDDELLAYDHLCQRAYATAVEVDIKAEDGFGEKKKQFFDELVSHKILGYISGPSDTYALYRIIDLDKMAEIYDLPYPPS